MTRVSSLLVVQLDVRADGGGSCNEERVLMAVVRAVRSAC